MSLQVAKPLHELLETEWDAQVFRGPNALAVMLGWTSYHTLRSKGSRTGYPDRTLVRDRIIFAELKREPQVGKKGQPLKLEHPLSHDQRTWLDAIAKAGGEAYVWIPSDYQEVGTILGHPWRLDGITLVSDSRVAWTPGSLWLRGTGRADGRPI